MDAWGELAGAIFVAQPPLLAARRRRRAVGLRAIAVCGGGSGGSAIQRVKHWADTQHRSVWRGAVRRCAAGRAGGQRAGHHQPLAGVRARRPTVRLLAAHVVVAILAIALALAVPKLG